MKSVLLTVIILSVVVLSVLQVFVSNVLSTEGIRLSRLEEETRSYQEKNAVLEEEIFRITALTHIASKAAEFGMGKTTSLLSIESKTRIALHQ